ncbi:MAG: DUF4291 domain-containing protein [Aureispira sp.]
MSGKTQEIRAHYNKDTITVYQAYKQQIALNALANNKFEKPFSFHRMTWIKPSYLWLMARSNWGTKSNQEYILGIELKRAYWEQALSKGILTHPDKNVYTSGKEWDLAFQQAPIHLQWDPERTLRNAKLPIRSIQVGIGRSLIEAYNTEWITRIVDYTPLTKKINALRKKGKYKEAKRLLPVERVYPLSSAIQKSIGSY